MARPKTTAHTSNTSAGAHEAGADGGKKTRRPLKDRIQSLSDDKLKAVYDDLTEKLAACVTEAERRLAGSSTLRAMTVRVPPVPAQDTQVA